MYNDVDFENSLNFGLLTKFVELRVQRTRVRYLQKRRKLRCEIPMDVLPEIVSDDAGYSAIDERLGFEFENIRLNSAIEKLSDKRRKIVLDRYIYGKSFQDIAREHGCTVKAVYGLLAKAMKTLRTLLLDGGGDDEDEH